MTSDSITIGGATYTNQYHYDGEGRRVKKVVGANTTVYVYNALGQLAAEYESPRQATNGGRRYVTADHLGSTRLITDEVGAVRSRHDYLPFGEELPVGVGGRQGSGYGDTAGVNQQFTGKERDAETGLDYFGARYFAGTQGRFTSPDQPFADQEEEDPQSWNLYAYTRNNPLKYVDDDGQALKLAITVAKALYKGYDAYSTVAGIVEGTKTVFSQDANVGTGERLKAAGEVILELSGASDVISGTKKALALSDKANDIRRIAKEGAEREAKGLAKAEQLGIELERKTDGTIRKAAPHDVGTGKALRDDKGKTTIFDGLGRREGGGERIGIEVSKKRQSRSEQRRKLHQRVRQTELTSRRESDVQRRLEIKID